MLKVFVGEDDPTQATYLSRLLSKFSSVETFLYRDGLELYQAIQAETPDFVISDNILPKLDGLSIARLTKFHEKTEEIPFIIVASTDTGELPGFDECGADVFLSKPVKVQELKAAMEKLFGEFD